MGYIIWLILPIVLLLVGNVYFSYKMFENSEELNGSRIVNGFENQESTEIYFPSNLLNVFASENSSDFVYGWMTEGCRGCREMIEELKNNNLSKELRFDNLKIFYHGDVEDFDKLRMNIEVIDIREIITKEEMGNMLKYSPVFFKLDEKNMLIRTSFTPSEYI